MRMEMPLLSRPYVQVQRRIYQSMIAFILPKVNHWFMTPCFCHLLHWINLFLFIFPTFKHLHLPCLLHLPRFVQPSSQTSPALPKALWIFFLQLARLLSGSLSSSSFDSVTVIDTRFPYEYEGGHIAGMLSDFLSLVLSLGWMLPMDLFGCPEEAELWCLKRHLAFLTTSHSGHSTYRIQTCNHSKLSLEQPVTTCAEFSAPLWLRVGLGQSFDSLEYRAYSDFCTWHCAGAINLYRPEDIEDLYNKSSSSCQRRCLVFHCEFSSARAPKLWVLSNGHPASLVITAFCALNRRTVAHLLW